MEPRNGGLCRYPLDGLDMKYFLREAGPLCLMLLHFCVPGSAWAAGQVVTFENTTGTSQSNVPVTFGLVFEQGAISADQPLEARPLASGASIPLQIDRKATYPDGSLRHAVASALLPGLAGNESRAVSIEPAMSEPTGQNVTLGDLSASGASLLVRLNTDGSEYTASLQDALSSVHMQWLQGPVASEWITSTWFRQSGSGTAHPHLQARFHVRKYSGSGSVKVDLVVENNTTWVGGLRNYTYDVDINSSGTRLYRKDSLTHFARARWKMTFWIGADPRVHIRHDPAALIASKAIPNYDPTLIGDLSSPVQAALAEYEKFSGHEMVTIRGHTVDVYGPMGIGPILEDMEAPGGREEIGPLPRWAVNYVLTQDRRAKHATLRMSDLAGSWPMHYRDETTGFPMSIEDYPWITIHGNAQPSEKPVATVLPDGSPYNPDSAHQPAFSFVPYLVTGDYYHIEEMHFWLAFILLRMPNGAVNDDGSYPGDVWYAYRGRHLGMVITHDQLRAKAWGLRTLAQVAAFTPDDHPMKGYYQRLMANNIEKGVRFVINNPEQDGGNPLGYARHGDGDLPNWMDDFFTWAIVYSTQLGFQHENLTKLADWKVKWVVNRHGFGENNPFCWLAAPTYRLFHRAEVGADGFATGAFLQTMEEIWNRNNRGQNSDIPTDSCQGNAYYQGEGLLGYPSNMQPAVAAAVDYGAIYAEDAWGLFAGRDSKPDFRGYPVWAIVPRAQAFEHAARPNPPTDVTVQ